MSISAVIGRERLTPSSAIGFTASFIGTPDGTQDPPLTEFVLIQASGGLIYFTIDGTTATSANGLVLTNRSKVEVHGAKAIKDFSCIDNGGAEELECVFMGRGG